MFGNMFFMVLTVYCLSVTTFSLWANSCFGCCSLCLNCLWWTWVTTKQRKRRVWLWLQDPVWTAASAVKTTPSPDTSQTSTTTCQLKLHFFIEREPTDVSENNNVVCSVSSYSKFSKQHSFLYKRTALPLTDEEKSIFTFQKYAPNMKTHTWAVSLWGILLKPEPTKTVPWILNKLMGIKTSILCKMNYSTKLKEHFR